MRFPRFLRIRDDKSADDATDPEQVTFEFANVMVLWLTHGQIAEMYERQALAQPSGGKKSKGGEGDDGGRKEGRS